MTDKYPDAVVDMVCQMVESIKQARGSKLVDAEEIQDALENIWKDPNGRIDGISEDRYIQVHYALLRKKICIPLPHEGPEKDKALWKELSDISKSSLRTDLDIHDQCQKLRKCYIEAQKHKRKGRKVKSSIPISELSKVFDPVKFKEYCALSDIKFTPEEASDNCSCGEEETAVRTKLDSKRSNKQLIAGESSSNPLIADTLQNLQIESKQDNVISNHELALVENTFSIETYEPHKNYSAGLVNLNKSVTTPGILDHNLVLYISTESFV